MSSVYSTGTAGAYEGVAGILQESFQNISKRHPQGYHKGNSKPLKQQVSARPHGIIEHQVILGLLQLVQELLVPKHGKAQLHLKGSQSPHQIHDLQGLVQCGGISHFVHPEVVSVFRDGVHQRSEAG